MGCVYVWSASVQRVRVYLGCTPRGVLAPGDAHAWGQRGYRSGLWGVVALGTYLCESVSAEGAETGGEEG